MAQEAGQSVTPPGPCHLARKDRERRLWRWRLQRPGPRRKAPRAARRGWRVTCAQGQQRLSDRCQSQQAPPGRAVGERPELRALGSGTGRPSWPELGHHWPGREGGKAPGDAEPPQRPLQVPTPWPNSAHMLPAPSAGSWDPGPPTRPSQQPPAQRSLGVRGPPGPHGQAYLL